MTARDGATWSARVVVSGVFSSYADNRELQSLQPAEVFDRSDAPELWLDYVADLGDGFDATYSLATLLAAPSLNLNGQETPRGEILVMGGDQVYPFGDVEAYEQRTTDVYATALPEPAGGTTADGLPYRKGETG